MKEIVFYFMNENVEFISSGEMKCSKSVFTNYWGWGESGKAI